VPVSLRRALAIVVLLEIPAASLCEQTMTVNTSSGVLRVSAPAFEIIDGVVLDRLHDGRSVRIDLELSVLAQPGAAAVTQARQSFNLSFDIWEERFAITHLTTPPRSVSHLKRKDGEAWCLERLTVPLAEMARFGRATPFWIRLSYQVPDPPPATGPGDETFTLQKLIEMLGRKRRDGQLGKSLEAGPFRLSN
jgi:hypothetical protein